MLAKFSLLLLLVISVTSEYHNENINNNFGHNHHRTKRADSGFWGFFQKIGSFTNIIADQYNDSRTTLQKLYETLQDNFSDTATTTPRSLEVNDVKDNTTTTTEKYRISRYESGRILGRNFRGLQKLLRLELNDALNQSQHNIVDYQREISNAIGPQGVQVNKELSKRKRKVYKRTPTI